MKKSRLLFLVVFVALMVMMPVSATFAQLSTVYLDVTNGSDSYSGENAKNSPENTGPKATFGGALGTVANNGTIIVRAGIYNGVDAAGADVVINTATYTNLAANGSLTIELRELSGNKQVDLSGGAFEYDVDGGTLNITSTNGDEYMSTVAGVTFGATKENVIVSIANAAYFRMATGQTLTMWGTSSFSSAAPQKGANLNLTYCGASNVNAGPEAEYGSYGSSVITVNKTKATDVVTFPATAITANGGIVITKGGATFQADVTVDGDVTVADAGNVNFTNLNMKKYDLTHNGTGTVAISGTLDFAIADAGAADGTDACLGSVEVTAAGTLTVTGKTTWTAANQTADVMTFTGANEYAVVNDGATVTLGAVDLVADDTDATGSFIIEFMNSANGSVTVGTITADLTATNNNKGTVHILNGGAADDASVFTLNGNVRGAVTNTAAASIALSGATTVADVLTNAGNVLLGGNTLTLSGSVPHNTIDGTVTATNGGIVVSATGASSFNGGTLSNVTVNGGTSGTCSFETAAIDVTNFTVTNGTAQIDIAVTASGATLVNGGTLDINAVVTTDDFTQSSGIVDLSDAAGPILDVNGDFSRIAGTFTAGDASFVKFTGAVAQSVAGGSLWTVGSLSFTNTAATITLDQSVRANNDVLISANTTLSLGTLNIILTKAGATITNNGSYTATGGGGVIFGGKGIIAGQTADTYATQTIGGTGTYSYITVAVGTGVTVSTAGAGEIIKWNGKLTLENGDLTVVANDELAPTGTSAEIVRNLVAATGSANGIIATAGVFNSTTPVDYDLTYTGALTADQYVAANSSEFDPTHVRDLTFTTTAKKVIITSNAALTVKNNVVIDDAALVEFRPVIAGVDVQKIAAKDGVTNIITTTSHSLVVNDWVTLAGLAADGDDGVYLVVASSDETHITVTSAAGLAAQDAADGTAAVAAYNVTVKGALTVGDDAVLSGGDAAKNIILDGDIKTHSVLGTVSALSPIKVTGSGVALNGGAATNQNTITDLLFEPAANDASFTSTDLEVIDDLTLQGTSVKTGATVTVTMNATSGALATFVMGNATVGPTASVTIDGTTATHTGILTVTNGDLTYTRNDAAAGTSTIGGAVTLTKGSLTLGSDVTVTDATSQTGGNLALGTFNYDEKDNYVHNGTGTITASTGVLELSGASKFTLTTALSVPNVKINPGGANATDLQSNDLTVTNNFNLASGTFDLNGNDLNLTGTIDLATGAVFLGTTSASTVTISGSTVTAVGGNFNFTSAINQLTLDIKSDGTVTFAKDGANARTYLVPILTQTKGTIALGENTLELIGDASGFVRTTGDWTMTTGGVKLNNATLTINPGTGGWSVDNLEVADNAATVTNHAFTVAKKLTLTAGTFTSNADGDITITDGATIERKLTTALLSKVPTMGAGNKMLYSGDQDADITTNKECAATVADFTVNRTTATAKNSEVILNANLTVTGTLFLTDGLLTETTTTGELTLANDAAINRTGNGAFTAGDVPTVTAYDLIYSGAVAITTAAEDFQAGLNDFTIQTTGDADVKLHVSRSLTGNFTLNAVATAGNDCFLDLDGYNFSVAGNVTITAGEIANSGTQGAAANDVLSQFTFNGAAAQTLTVPGVGYTFPYANVATDEEDEEGEGVELKINNTSTDGVTLAGGDLTIQNANPSTEVNIIRFVDGVFNIGSNGLTLWQSKTATGVPVQGFDRTGVTGTNKSHVVGEITKFINKTSTVANANVQFPVGTAAGEYRPVTTYFTNTPQSSFNMVVSHENTSPGGENGIPLTVGDQTVTNYPDFYWVVTATPGLAPSYQWDIELQAENYPEYAEDGIQNIRMIRRTKGSLDNPWVLQGLDANYDNYTAATNWPSIKVIDSEGGLTSAGNIFTYSQSNKAPTFTSAIGNVTIGENDSSGFTYIATDPDIGQTVTLSAITLPTWANFNASTGVLSYEPSYVDSGEYTVTIRATDGIVNTDTTCAITVTDVNRPPVFTVMPDDVTMDELTAYTFTYVAADSDVETVYYAVVDSPATDVAITSAGVVTFTTEAGLPAGQVDTLVVSITDSVDTPTVFVNDTLLITVVKQVAPVFTAGLVDQTINTGDTVAFTYIATDGNTPVGDVLTFAIVDAPEGASIVAATGVFEWIVTNDQVGDSILVAVSVTDETDKAVNDTAYVNVMSVVLGDVSLNGTVSAYDASLVLQHVAGRITMTGDSLTLADVTENGSVSALDASYILQKVAGNETLFKSNGLSKTIISTGNMNWERLSSNDEEIVNVSMTLTDAKNVYSLEYVAEVDPSIVKIEKVSANLPRGWQMVKNIENGVLTVAMAGIIPLTDTQIANVQLRILNKNNPFMITGNATINENNSKELTNLEIKQVPAEFKLSQNYPNPFNPITTIDFQLPEDNRVIINIYDILGNKVKTLVNENKTAGYYTVTWNGLNDNGLQMASGTYFYHIQSGKYNSTQKMLLLK